MDKTHLLYFCKYHKESECGIPTMFGMPHSLSYLYYIFSHVLPYTEYSAVLF